MKKTIVLLGSPRRNGNSEILAAKAMEGIKAAGGRCEAFYLNKMNIRPCQACEYCRRNSEKRCVLKDDMQPLYQKLKEADAMLLASPIYMFTFSAQLKLFMDRCFACYDSLAGKRIGILLTYGDTDEYTSGAINAINTFKDEYRYTRSEIVGIVHGSADAKGEIASNARLLEQAFLLGRELAEGQAAGAPELEGNRV